MSLRAQTIYLKKQRSFVGTCVVMGRVTDGRGPSTVSGLPSKTALDDKGYVPSLTVTLALGSRGTPAALVVR